MNKIDFLDKYILPFKYFDWIYKKDEGFIVWREATGNNIELLHIKTFRRGQGFGYQLVKDMVMNLKIYHKPYHSIFGYMVTGNKRGTDFYKGIGFNLVETGHIYQAGTATMFWQKFDVLCEKMGVS